jgi:hypothetical protein
MSNKFIMNKNYLLRLTSVVLCMVAFLVVNPSILIAQSADQPQSQAVTTQPAPTPAGFQNIADHVCKGVISADQGSFPEGTTLSSCKENSESSFGFLAQRIINIFSLVVGVVSVIMIIIGGFRYIISGGDSSSVQGAKNTILYAIVGLLIVVFAQVIIRFVLTNVAPTTS